MGNAGVVDAAAAQRLLEQARWLADRQTTRLSSVESRAGIVVAWGATQVSITALAIALLPNLPGGWARDAGASLLAVGGLAAVAAVLMVVLGIIRARAVPAPEVDLLGLRDWVTLTTASDAEEKVIDVLVGSLTDPGEVGGEDRAAVLPDLAEAIDQRARWLSRATMILATAVAFDAAAALALAYSTTN